MASSAAQLLIQSVGLYLKWYNYSWFASLAAKGKLRLLLY